MQPAVYRGHAERIVRAVLDACHPAAALRRAMEQSSNRGKPTGIIAAGKAAWSMVNAIEDLVGRPREFTVVEPAGYESLGTYVADHPVPTRRNLECAEVVQRRARRYGPEAVGHFAVCTVLLSGGASACLALPVPEVTLEDLAAITRALLRAGAAIEELNTVRRHIEVLKGGGLAAALAPMPVDVYVLSDVVGDALHSIGSGPSAPDPTTFADAITVIDTYELWHTAPSVTAYLTDGAQGRRPETRKPGDLVFDRVRTAIIASNATAVSAAGDSAGTAGFEVAESMTGVIGEASDIGRALARRAIEVAGQGSDGPRAIVWGGETTVMLGLGDGKGGRNQELALAAAVELAGSPAMADRVVVITLATDGVDGPTDAAGAVVTGRAILDGPGGVAAARDALQRHDSYTYLDRLGCLIRTGPTGTNVNDVSVALVA